MLKNKFETEESYLKRKWFVRNYLESPFAENKIKIQIKNQNKNQNKNKKNSSEAERLSEIWINMITLHCRYQPSIEKQIYAFVNTMNMNTTNQLKIN